jgi:acetolactate synthase-1/2/3 large subunit
MQTLIQTQEETRQKQTVHVSGSEALLMALQAEGVTTIFGYPGGAIMPVYDALYGYRDSLKHVLTRHEQGAIHAAQGYARISGETGVCFATSGPGATNLITGLADAYMDSTPLVCFSGQVASPLLGTDGFQETDIVSISMPVTKWNFQVTKAEELSDAIAKAFYIARTGRPGPVLIDIAKDIQLQHFDFSYEPCTSIRSYVPVPPTENGALEAAAELINLARKPMILVGQGVILGNAQKEFVEFAEKTGIPVASTLLGLSALPNEHPQFVGMLGMHGNAAPNIKTNECDLLIAMGMRFDDRVTGKVSEYAKQAKVIHFEIDKAEVDKIIKVDVAVLGNVKQTLSQLLPMLEKNRHETWLNTFSKIYNDEYKRVIEKELFPVAGNLSMGEVLEHLNSFSKGKAIVVTDVGQHQMMTARYYRFNNTRSFVTSGGLGTMGFALPAAMGAQMASNGRQVVAIIGDGGFQMTLQELGTIAQEKLPVKIIVLNNNYLGMVRQWQELFFEERYSETNISSPDFCMIASSYGIKSKKITHRDQLVDGVKELWEAKETYLLEVVVEKKGMVFPMMPAGAAVDDIVFGDEEE